MSDPIPIYHPHYGPALSDANWVPAPRYLLRRDRVLRHVKTIAPCKALDIGCGPAALLSEMASLGFDAYGVDRSQQALVLARMLNTQQSPMQLQAELDPAWKGSFDLLMSFEVIEHLDEDIAAMRDWLPYLKPGGRFILSTPAHPHRWNAADVWAGHVRRYTRAGLEKSITDAGFIVEKIECYGFPLANLMEILRAKAYGKVLNQATKADKSADDLTDESGSDRSIESKFWRFFSSMPATVLMRLACQFQRPFLQTDYGNGYLVIARAP
jgi:2-polyprenyl-3-methyl-5-hydroxy-6-metoxy-1,4-benzoquinol methylase